MSVAHSLGVEIQCEEGLQTLLSCGKLVISLSCTRPEAAARQPTSHSKSQTWPASFGIQLTIAGIPFWLVGAPLILVCFSGDWDVHWGCDLDLTHGQLQQAKRSAA